MPQDSTAPDLIGSTLRVIEAVNRRDLSALTLAAVPDVVWDSPPLGTTLRGIAAVRGFLEDYLAAFEEYRQDVEEIIDLGHGILYAVLRQEVRPVRGTARIESRLAWIAEWVDGRIVRVATYYDVAEARSAAERLAREPGRPDDQPATSG